MSRLRRRHALPLEVRGQQIQVRSHFVIETPIRRSLSNRASNRLSQIGMTYSLLSTSAGSMRLARIAGTLVATSALMPSTPHATVTVAGS